MSNAQTVEPQKPLRLWPGVVIVMLQWLGRFGVPAILPDATPFAVLAGLLGGLAIIVWWGFFSRARRFERWGAIVLMIVAMLVTSRFIHESIATSMMGMTFVVYAIPVLSLAFVLWALASSHLSEGPRRVTMVVTILLACGLFTLVRTGGFTADLDHDFAWRWSETPEERLLARASDELTALPSAAAAPDQGAAWPGFRGPDRDSVIPGVQIATDWSASPPVELWRRPIGPGWSSFAVSGDFLYTQEQRGEDEVVSCYNVNTGGPVWKHRDKARFWEANAGAGPRGTPTLSGDRVYTLGATGILNALDAGDGRIVWSRNAASDTDATLPGWGYAGSPLVVDDVVIAAAAGRLAAYDLDSGDPRWLGPEGGDGYSSPHLLTIDGIEQVLLMSQAGATSVAAADGSPLWDYPLPAGTRIVQPAMTAGGDLLISSGEGSGGTGVRRIAVAHQPGGWTVEERWTSNKLKPYFSDFVVHEGHAYGVDGNILACIDLEKGKRKWKRGRYGGGQLILLPDQDVLLVLSEKGELALVAAVPDQFVELARFPAIEGKTWNHPVLVDDILLVRNAEEMVAFRLSLAGG